MTQSGQSLSIPYRIILKISLNSQMYSSDFDYPIEPNINLPHN